VPVSNPFAAKSFAQPPTSGMVHGCCTHRAKTLHHLCKAHAQMVQGSRTKHKTDKRHRPLAKNEMLMSRMMQKDWRDRQKECLHIQKKKRNFARRIRLTQKLYI
jgi:hypothetical protein